LEAKIFLGRKMQEPFQAHTPIVHAGGFAFPKESIWLMLSGGKEGKEAEDDIVRKLKNLCRMHNIPINRSKHVMLEAIQRHDIAGQVFVKSYMSWYTLNRKALSGDTTDDLPDHVAVQVGSVEHKCKRA
jgi:hypothetical protein